MRRILLAVLASLMFSSGVAGEPQSAMVTIPFLEIHTGPADVYPVAQVIERGDTLTVLKERTGWYKVRGPRGQEGWVSADKLQEALEPSAE